MKGIVSASNDDPLITDHKAAYRIQIGAQEPKLIRTAGMHQHTSNNTPVTHTHHQL